MIDRPGRHRGARSGGGAATVGPVLAIGDPTGTTTVDGGAGTVITYANWRHRCTAFVPCGPSPSSRSTRPAWSSSGTPGRGGLRLAARRGGRAGRWPRRCCRPTSGLGPSSTPPTSRRPCSTACATGSATDSTTLRAGAPDRSPDRSRGAPVRDGPGCRPLRRAASSAPWSPPARPPPTPTPTRGVAGPGPSAGPADRPAQPGPVRRAARPAAVGESQGVPGSVAVVLLDLDRFKAINNTMGHDAGDLVLASVAARGCSRSPATPSSSPGSAATSSWPCSRNPAGDRPCRRHRLHRAGAGRAGRTVRGRRDRGVPRRVGGRGPQHLRGGRRRRRCCPTPRPPCTRPRTAAAPGVETFGESMRIEVLDRMSTEHSLHRALERSELMLHYQPVVEIDGVTTVGRRGAGPVAAPRPGAGVPLPLHPGGRGERPDHPHRGLGARGGLPPAAGLAAPGPGRAARARWRSTCPPARSTTPGSSGRSSRSWPAPGCPPEHLTLEITESALMQDAAVGPGRPAGAEGARGRSWPSTTSAPATRRSATSSASPWTS